MSTPTRPFGLRQAAIFAASVAAPVVIIGVLFNLHHRDEHDPTVKPGETHFYPADLYVDAPDAGYEPDPTVKPHETFYPAEPYHQKQAKKATTYYDNPDDTPWYAPVDGYTPWPTPIRIAAGAVLGALVTALIMCRRNRLRSYEPPHDPKPKTGSFEEHTP